MRAVLDTNVLISGLLWRGTPYACLLAAEAGLFQMVLAESILDELREKLLAKFGDTEEETSEAINGLRRCALLVETSGQSGWVSADPDDDKFIEAALIGKADVVVFRRSAPSATRRRGCAAYPHAPSVSGPTGRRNG